MAESAVRSSIDVLGKILVEEGKYLWGVEGKVKELRNELLWMRSFLRQAETFQHKDEIVWMWVCQVQEHVYEAEDIMDKFVIQVASRRRQNGFLNKLRRYSCFLRELYYLHRAASSIDSLKDEISTLSPRLEKYGRISAVSEKNDQVEEARVEHIQHILKNAHLEHKKIIGFENNAKEIISNLKSLRKTFHAIYTMGGVGKTTLATKVFKDDAVKEHFSGGQAFVYVSKHFDVGSVIEEVYIHLKVSDHKKKDKSSEVETDPELRNPKEEKKSLQVEVQEFIKGNKCLVVLDDVWTKEGWDSLKSTFALHDRESGSKVLLTTRKEDVAKYVDIDALQKPDPLNEAYAWELLQKTMGLDLKESSITSKQLQDHTKTDGTNDGANQIQDEIKTVDTEDGIQMINLAKKMLEVCKGIPLFIVVLGGILRKKQTVAGWKSVLDNITSHLRAGYDHGRSCMEILLQSYNDLPYYLKPCFLHLANFPEDYEISTRSLYRMWVAEGLVTWSMCGRAIHTRCLEDVANDYLNDLARVGLVEILDATSEGWINSIRMHDLLRDVCCEKANTDNVVKTIDLCSGRGQQLNTSDYYSVKRLLRMAIYLPDGSIESFIEDYLSSKAPKYLRSLMLFPSGEGPSHAECQQLMTCICSEFQLLRVLVIENKFHFRGRLTSKVENLIHLRYLSLANTKISELPSCIGKLRFLEMLDLRVRWKLTIPNTLWKLFRLRYLLFPRCGYKMKWLERLRIDTLICLEVIENLVVKNLQTEGMRKMKNLRQLSIVWEKTLSRKAAMDVIIALESNRFNIFFLHIEGSVIRKEPMLLSRISFNVELKISGKIQGGNLGQLPQHLEKLILSECHIEDDPMGILGWLDHLKSLTFQCGSYVGTKLSCPPKSFPLLERLSFSELEVLEEWELGSGSMPRLNSLEIFMCDKLKRTPYVLPLSLQEMQVSEVKHGWMYLHESDHEIRLKNELLDGESANIVLLGKGSEGVVVDALESKSYPGRLFLHHFDVIARNRVSRRRSCRAGGGLLPVPSHFDAIARTRVPRSRSSRAAGGGLLPRGSLQKLLRDLRDPKQSIKGQDLSWMSCDDLMAELQQVMKKKKCLVILINLEVDDDHLQADLEKTFGNPRTYGRMGSKLLITFESHTVTSLPARECQIQLTIPIHLQMLGMIYNASTGSSGVETDAGIKWNIMSSCLRQGLSPEMCKKLLERDEIIRKWATEQEKLIDSSPIEPSPIFTLYYEHLELDEQRCLLYLANFPEEVEISIRKFRQMCTAAGIVKEMNAVKPILWTLRYKGMVTQKGTEGSLGEFPWQKTCQLKLGLRDLCLAKAKENPNIEKHLAVHLDQNSISSASLIKKLSLPKVASSLTSLLFFPYVNDPLYNEESWEWLLYICNHFYLLRVLDLQQMWMTKGSLPKEIGELRQLRYLSLRGTWVTQLPHSIEDLSHLQTLDLRVWEAIIIPDVLWKLPHLMHLYLPDFIAQETAKLQVNGLSCLETLVNLHTDKVCLTDLLELKLLKKISIRNIHAVEVVDELDAILNKLSSSLDEVCINSEIINANPTILEGFQNLHNLKIKGMILGKLHPKMFPTNLEEVTLKHTKLEEDPLSVLEKLPQLRRLTLGHESYLGKEMTFSQDFYERATKLALYSLNNLQKLYSPHRPSSKIRISDCWRVEEEEWEEEEDVHTYTGSFNLSSLKKGFKALTSC